MFPECCAITQGNGFTIDLPGARNGNAASLPDASGSPSSSLVSRGMAASDADGSVIVSGDGGAYGSGARREVPFQMVNPFRPIVRTRSPVTGLNAWPIRKIGDRYYSFGRQGVQEFRPFGSLGQDDFGPGDIVGQTPGPALPGVPVSYSYPSEFPQGPSTLQSILATIQTTLPATISALKKQPYYNPAGSLQSVYSAPSGFIRDASGQLIPTGSAASAGAGLGAGVAQLANSLTAFVTQNPLLVMGGGVALLLFFREPPRRRNPAR